MNKILFASSEAYPLIKTGGLADVAAALPRSLQNSGRDVRLIIPAYRGIKDQLTHSKVIGQRRILDIDVQLIQALLPGTRVKLWLVDAPALFDRDGDPYHDGKHKPWSDNAKRFGVFCHTIAQLASASWDIGWQPHVVHCNDWQTALVPMLLSDNAQRPSTVFTIHNLAHQGIFDWGTFKELELNQRHWHADGVEYYGQFAFIKAGLIYADRITTVSPSYAEEIQTPEFGFGLEGVLSNRRHVLSGIVNGIDEKTWNPGTDAHLPHSYRRRQLQGKRDNKSALQKACTLEIKPNTLLVGMVSRLVWQKGIDIILAALPDLLKQPIQLVVLGSGEARYQEPLQQLAFQHPGRVHVELAYDESMAHLIEAGADAFLMPSRFEPCGLNQMYSQRYGTPPIVSPVGGLKDTVIDASASKGTGFVLKTVDANGLTDAVQRTLDTYRNPALWRGLMDRAMAQNFSWKRSAQAYLDLYADINK